MATATVVVTTTYTSDSGIVFDTTNTDSYTGLTANIQFGKSIGTAVEDIATFGAAGSGAITTPSVIIVKNQDPTNFIILGLKDTGGDTAYVKVLPGKTVVINSDDLDANTAGSAFAAFSTIDTLTAEADTSACILTVQIYGV